MRGEDEAWREAVLNGVWGLMGRRESESDAARRTEDGARGRGAKAEHEP